MFEADIITLFPGPVQAYLESSIMGRSSAKGLARLCAVDLKDYCGGNHHLADGEPFGGGAGMLLKPEPIFAAVEDLRRENTRVILTDPGGRVLDHPLARELSLEEHLVFICGRYKGVDERVRTLADLELSLGDFVLSGGELVALAAVEAAVRLIPGVLSDAEAALEDSFEGEGFLDCPWYTRPAAFRGMTVPEVLLSGDHEAVKRWRRERSLERTSRLRPDLLDE
ncbi:MAG: tRNA (guanosine(37)-N1)-methyltransferase TrmD [bacterium]|nr:tRNA (guanosine(37)-N1)-methyltransferase TrmD [bacterium]